MDGMNGIVYLDDAQIMWFESVKHYSDNPRTEIFVGEF